jgi:hypothetical protein
MIANHLFTSLVAQNYRKKAWNSAHLTEKSSGNMEAESHKAGLARYIEQLVEDYQGENRFLSI